MPWDVTEGDDGGVGVGSEVLGERNAMGKGICWKEGVS